MDNRGRTAPIPGGQIDLETGRERALDMITTAFARGIIPIEDYEKRAGAIQNAKSFPDLDAQVIDLPPLPEEAPSATRIRAPSRGPAPREPLREPKISGDFLVEEKLGSPEFSLCIMGDRKLQGDWLQSDQATSFTLMGSTTLDLRDTALPPGRLKIDAFAIMGEVRILVPRGLPVRMSAFPFMGEATVQASVERRVERGRPWVDVSGLALMGSIVVKSV
ncbi:MAG TPA: LiaF domain-containing protein [Rectinemataceae bacterium]